MPPGAPRRPPWPGRPAREGGPCPEHRDFARTTWRFGEPGHAGAGRAEPPGADEVLDSPRGGGGSQAETARWDPHFRENEMCPTGRPERPGLEGGERGTARRQAPCPSPIASTGKRPPGHSALHRPPPRHPHPVPERLSPSLLTSRSTTCHLSPRRRRSLGNTHRLCPLLADHPVALRARRPST